PPSSLPSFPTRRSSDLHKNNSFRNQGLISTQPSDKFMLPVADDQYRTRRMTYHSLGNASEKHMFQTRITVSGENDHIHLPLSRTDRKSTRLNSSHVAIS